MSKTTTPSGADVDPLVVLKSYRPMIAAVGAAGGGAQGAAGMAKLHCALETAVAALIKRNAELEAQTPSALREKLRSCEEALQAVEADRDALVGERDALRPNAERYLWLRYRTGGRKVQWGTEFHFPGVKVLPARLPDWPAACNVGEYLDAAIDLARTPAKENNDG